MRYQLAKVLPTLGEIGVRVVARPARRHQDHIAGFRDFRRLCHRLFQRRGNVGYERIEDLGIEASPPRERHGEVRLARAVGTLGPCNEHLGRETLLDDLDSLE